MYIYGQFCMDTLLTIDIHESFLLYRKDRLRRFLELKGPARRRA